MNNETGEQLNAQNMQNKIQVNNKINAKASQRVYILIQQKKVF